MWQNVKQEMLDGYSNFQQFIGWTVFAVAVGVMVGTISVLFHFAIEIATELRLEYPWIIYFLPIGGIAIIAMYRFFGMKQDKGTNFILVAVRSNEPVSVCIAPLIFVSTVITHLFGGSSGREGAALQLGGSISAKLGRLVKLDEKDERVITMCGMSAAFSALFGTPITAVIFSMEVITVGVMHYSAMVPCVVSALIGMGIASMFGILPTSFDLLGVPAHITVAGAGSVALLGIGCAVLSILFCAVMKKTSYIYRKYIPNTMLRAFAGGCIVLALTLLLGTRDYNGAGMGIIAQAIQGNAKPEAFLLKILFTALTLGAGFKGGEIVPTFFVGATFGCVVGQFLGLSPSFSAGLAMAALFCGVTNCPLTSVILCIELFGVQGLGYYALICAVSYMLSGYYGLYSEQKIMYSKIRPEFINRNAG